MMSSSRKILSCLHKQGMRLFCKKARAETSKATLQFSNPSTSASTVSSTQPLLYPQKIKVTPELLKQYDKNVNMEKVESSLKKGEDARNRFSSY